MKRWRSAYASGAVAVAVTVGLLGAAMPAVVRAVERSAPGAELVHAAVFPDATDAALADVRVRVMAGSAAFTVTLQRGDQVIRTRNVPAAGGVAVLDADGLAEGRYTVNVAQGAETTTLRVSIYRGWAPIDADQPSWARCRTITWSYDARRAPANGDRSMVRDISATLSALRSTTGLQFSRVSSGGALVYKWGNTGGADGVGGVEWTNGPGTVTRGTVTLSPRSSWARTPGPSERQVLLLHETAHAVGLGHVTNNRSLMSPTYRPGLSRATLGAGEIRALRTIYRPSTCS